MFQGINTRVPATIDLKTDLVCYKKKPVTTIFITLDKCPEETCHSIRVNIFFWVKLGLEVFF